MQKIIIVSGICCTGKSSFACELKNRLSNCAVLSVDSCKEFVWDNLGFNNLEEKAKTKNIAFDVFRFLIKETIDRGTENIIIEYPFTAKDYQTIEGLFTGLPKLVVNMADSDFESLWERLDYREKYDSRRHCGHCTDVYSKNMKDIVRRNMLTKEQLFEEYVSKNRELYLYSIPTINVEFSGSKEPNIGTVVDWISQNS